MCNKCVELDGKIEHYKRISASISDQLAIDRNTELVEQMKAQKAALHPEPE
jgi:FAD/FMN-containing dehydrogenase